MDKAWGSSRLPRARAAKVTFGALRAAVRPDEQAPPSAGAAPGAGMAAATRVAVVPGAVPETLGARRTLRRPS